MRHLRSIRRVALGAAVVGATIGAVPAMASAASTCVYNPTTKQVSVEENAAPSAILQLRQELDGHIAIKETNGPVQICTNQVDFFTVAATVFNTDQINVSSKSTTQSKRISLGQFGPGATPETDGISEIETVVTSNNPHLSLHLFGSSGPDRITLGPAGIGGVGINYGLDNFGTDNDIDVRTTTRPERVFIETLDGDDIISGRGILNSVGTNVRLTLDGGAGNDFVEGGLGRDTLIGGGGDDRLFSNDGQLDLLDGGPGFDTATTDANESVVTSVEQRTVEPVGHLRLARCARGPARPRA